MSRELLKRAVRFMSVVGCSNDDICELCDEIETYLAQPDKPVAARLIHDDGSIAGIVRLPISREEADHIEESGLAWENLYTTPPDQSARVAELELALARANADIESLEDRLIVKNQRVYECNEKLAALQAKREPLSIGEIESCRLKSFEDDFYEDVDWGVTATKRLNVITFARAIEQAVLKANGFKGE